jgi:hypothetical protein
VPAASERGVRQMSTLPGRFAVQEADVNREQLLHLATGSPRPRAAARTAGS